MCLFMCFSLSLASAVCLSDFLLFSLSLGSSCSMLFLFGLCFPSYLFLSLILRFVCMIGQHLHLEWKQKSSLYLMLCSLSSFFSSPSLTPFRISFHPSSLPPFLPLFLPAVLTSFLSSSLPHSFRFFLPSSHLLSVSSHFLLSLLFSVSLSLHSFILSFFSFLLFIPSFFLPTHP